jgi:hypothetical protein
MLTHFWYLDTGCLQPQFCKMSQITLSVHWQPCEDSCFVLWEPSTTLANHCGPQQHQCPLGWVPLVTAHKDADSQCSSESCCFLETAHLEHTQQQAQPVVTETHCEVHRNGQPAHSHLIADARKTALASINQSTAAGALPAFIRNALP